MAPSWKAYVCSDEDFAKELAYLKEKVDAGVRAYFSLPAVEC